MTTTTATKPTASETAKAIIAKAKELGFSVSAHGCILTVSRTFTPGDSAAFRDCDMEYGTVFALAPRTEPGSEWGTDGGSVGGYAALKSGRFTMHKSGVSKRVIAAIAKAIG